MGFKAKLGAASATVVVALAAPAALATSAGAATPSCGSNCSDLYSQKFGQHYLLDVFGAKAVRDQEIILFQTSNSDPAEDFRIVQLGKVKSFYDKFDAAQSIVSSGFAQAYGNETAYEFIYEPDGVNGNNLCAGTWPGQAATPGFKVRLEACGAANTLWAQDTQDAGTGSGSFYPYINGTDTNFSDPLVLNYPAGYPTDHPRPWMNVQPLQNYGTGAVYDNQMWKYKAGPAS